MSSDFTPSSEGTPQVEDGPQERPVDAEWRQWLDRASQEEYEDDLDPFQYTYSQLSRMTVLCYRLFVGLRNAQGRLDGITAGRAYAARAAFLALQQGHNRKAENILEDLLQGKWDDYVPEGEENE